MSADRSDRRRDVIILEPWLDQARSLARFLRRYDKQSRVIGAITSEEPIPISLRPFHELRRKSMDELLALSDDNVVFPTGYLSTWTFVRMKGGIQVGGSHFREENLRAYDKVWTLRTADELGIPIPLQLSDPGSMERFPVFYKSRTEGSHRRGIARSMAELEALEERESLIFQENIATPFFYGVYFLADEGEIVTDLTVRSLRETPPTGGSSVVMEPFHHPLLLDYTRRMVERMDYSGWGMTEFKSHPSRDDFVFMELNAKLCASVELLFLLRPQFLGRLFGISYEPRDVGRIVFADRLLDYGLREYLAGIVRHSGSHFVELYPSLRRALGMAAGTSIQAVRQRS